MLVNRSGVRWSLADPIRSGPPPPATSSRAASDASRRWDSTPVPWVPRPHPASRRWSRTTTLSRACERPQSHSSWRSYPIPPSCRALAAKYDGLPVPLRESLGTVLCRARTTPGAAAFVVRFLKDLNMGWHRQAVTMLDLPATPELVEAVYSLSSSPSSRPRARST